MLGLPSPTAYFSARVIHASSIGCKLDGRAPGCPITAAYAADGAITTGTATFTSATAAFTSADVGKTIQIAGANTSGNTLITTISAVTNATTVTLAANAVLTVSAKHWTIGTDDTTKIQAALTALKALGGGKLVVDGIALVTHVKVPSNVTIEGAAPQHGFLHSANSGESCVINENYPGSAGGPVVVTSGALVTGQNTPICTASDSNIRLENLTVYGNQNAGPLGNLTTLSSVPASPPTGGYLNGNTPVANAFYPCVMLVGTKDVTLRNVTIREGACFNLFVQNFQNFRFQNLTIVNSNAGFYTDGFDMVGPGNVAIGDGLHLTIAGDDAFAIAGDDSGGPQGMPNGFAQRINQGAIFGVEIDNITLNGCKQGIGLYSPSNRVDGVVLRGVRGSTTGFWARSINQVGNGSVNGTNGNFGDIRFKDVEMTGCTAAQVTGDYDRLEIDFSTIRPGAFSGVLQDSAVGISGTGIHTPRMDLKLNIVTNFVADSAAEAAVLLNYSRVENLNVEGSWVNQGTAANAAFLLTKPLIRMGNSCWKLGVTNLNAGPLVLDSIANLISAPLGNLMPNVTMSGVRHVNASSNGTLKLAGHVGEVVASSHPRFGTQAILDAVSTLVANQTGDGFASQVTGGTLPATTTLNDSNFVTGGTAALIGGFSPTGTPGNVWTDLSSGANFNVGTTGLVETSGAAEAITDLGVSSYTLQYTISNFGANFFDLFAMVIDSNNWIDVQVSTTVCRFYRKLTGVNGGVAQQLTSSNWSNNVTLVAPVTICIDVHTGISADGTLTGTWLYVYIPAQTGWFSDRVGRQLFIPTQSGQTASPLAGATKAGIGFANTTQRVTRFKALSLTP